MSNMTFIDFDIFHQMEPLQKSYSITMTYIFKVKIATSLNYFYRFISNYMAPDVELLSFNLKCIAKLL